MKGRRKLTWHFDCKPLTESDTREDLGMKTWTMVGLGLALMVIMGRSPAGAGDPVVTGVIANWPQVKSRVAEGAYFQVVRQEEKLSGHTDNHGRAVLKSALPRVELRSSGGFRVNLAKAPPGEYFIALQRGLPTTPILVKDGRPVLIRVPGDFPLNLGRVRLELPLGLTAPKAHMEVAD